MSRTTIAHRSAVSAVTLAVATLVMTLLGLAIRPAPEARTDSAAPAQPTGPAVYLPLNFRTQFRAQLPTPHYRPRATATPLRTPSATPSPSATFLPPGTPGIPPCARTTGDLGGFRFSLDGGKSLAANDHPLASLAYTWDLDVDPRDPNVVLESHESELFISPNAGCNFKLLARFDYPFDDIVRSPSNPEVLVLTSIFNARLIFSADDGRTWKSEVLPDDVIQLAIDPQNPWHWAFAGRTARLFVRDALDQPWDERTVTGPTAGEQLTAASQATGRPGRWLVGSQFSGLFRSDDEGRTWQPASGGLFATVGEPPETVSAVVVASVSSAASDPDVAYAALNQVGLSQSLRGLWRTTDGGLHWERRVADGQSVGDTKVSLTGGSRVWVSPRDAAWAFFAFGSYVDQYGTDLYRSHDGLGTLEVGHFADFFEMLSMAFGPQGSNAVYVGASNDLPSR